MSLSFEDHYGRIRGRIATYYSHLPIVLMSLNPPLIFRGYCNTVDLPTSKIDVDWHLSGAILYILHKLDRSVTVTQLMKLEAIFEEMIDFMIQDDQITLDEDNWINLKSNIDNIRLSNRALMAARFSM